MENIITEIEVEGVGTMRHLNSYQIVRLRSMAKGPNRAIAPMAFGLGMTVRQFKRLTPEQQRAAWHAHNRLTGPGAYGQLRPAAEQGPRLPRAWERVFGARMTELGRNLINVKEQLPHGHFLPWVEEKSGITRTQAQRFMRAARDAEKTHFKPARGPREP